MTVSRHTLCAIALVGLTLCGTGASAHTSAPGPEETRPSPAGHDRIAANTSRPKRQRINLRSIRHKRPVRLNGTARDRFRAPDGCGHNGCQPARSRSHDHLTDHNWQLEIEG